MCHESSGLGLTQSIGIGKGTVKLVGLRARRQHLHHRPEPRHEPPADAQALEKAARNGVQDRQHQSAGGDGDDPLQAPAVRRWTCSAAGRRSPSLFLPVRINGDVAVLKGIMKEMLEMDRASGGQVFDHAFIAEKTARLRRVRRGPRRDDLGRDRRGLRRLARAASGRPREIAATSERMITCWAMGITQHQNGVANVQTIVNFHLLRGQIGRQGAGVCPVRGHSNVQGDRTVGIWEQMSDRVHATRWARNSASTRRASTATTRSRPQAMHEGKVKVFFGLGGNFSRAGPTPSTPRTRSAARGSASTSPRSSTATT